MADRLEDELKDILSDSSAMINKIAQLENTIERLEKDKRTIQEGIIVQLDEIGKRDKVLRNTLRHLVNQQYFVLTGGHIEEFVTQNPQTDQAKFLVSLYRTISKIEGN